MNRRLGQSGAILLEVLCAVTIVAIVALATVRNLEQAIDGSRRAVEEESQMEASQRVLAAMSLLNRRDLDMRIGVHPAGEFLIDVRRPKPDLYRIAIKHQRAPASDLLATVVYREAGAP